MSQEPWNEEIYEGEHETRRSRSSKGKANTMFFTILGIIFIIIVLLVTAIGLYLSSGGSKTNSTEEFYNTSASSSTTSSSEISSTESSSSSSSSEEEVEEQVTETSSVETTDGTTLTVLAGEGQASIAERAGISIAELERLNPDKLTGPGGTWWANPGDVVKIK